jgi:hypothetical protein
MQRSSWRTALLVCLALAALGGCASDPRYKDGASWVQWQEAEKRRLEQQGFPQYTGGP